MGILYRVSTLAGITLWHSRFQAPFVGTALWNHARVVVVEDLPPRLTPPPARLTFSHRAEPPPPPTRLSLPSHRADPPWPGITLSRDAIGGPLGLWRNGFVDCATKCRKKRQERRVDPLLACSHFGCTTCGNMPSEMGIFCLGVWMSPAICWRKRLERQPRSAPVKGVAE